MAMIRYDIEVERTVTVTATPLLGNSRHAVKTRSGFFVVAGYAVIAVLLVLAVVSLGGLVEHWQDVQTSFGNAPDDEPFPNTAMGLEDPPQSPKPHVKSKAPKVKPELSPVERTDIEPAQREAESVGAYKYNGGGWNSTWCAGTANLPPVPAMCEWAVRSQRR